MTALVKGLLTFTVELLIYAVRSITNNGRRVNRENRTKGWRPPDENITGNRNSQRIRQPEQAEVEETEGNYYTPEYEGTEESKGN